MKGALKVSWDTTTSVIQVLLPESYTDNIVSLDLTFHDGASLQYYEGDTYITENKVGFIFKGARPVDFTIRKKTGERWFAKDYKVYVEHQGKLTAEITSPLEMQAIYGESRSTIYTQIKLLSGVGTIPERPEDLKTLSAGLADLEKNITVKGSAYASHLDFPNAQSLIASSKLSVSLMYGDKIFTFPNTYQPVRGDVRAGMHTFSFFAKKKAIEISGGYFINGIKYQVKMENDFVKEPIWLNAEVQTPANLTFVIPEGVTNGDYLFSIYEGENLLSSTNFLVSDENLPVKGIGKLWTEKLEYPSGSILFKDSKRVSLNKGQVFYADPKPWIYGDYYKPWDPNKKMPDLELKNNKSVIVISAKTNGDPSYADASIPLYYCEYKIPADIVSGNYEARMIYENGEKSAPWWALVNIN
ncbi:hypothetical protein [Dyadobacter sp. CY312]|uniref:hypothetical protein n=1 Tax=Dyadobacter sp. CY312 TaxID=2907303 RepID=UPI001F409870|nr:hypothetical protein [Dyadobacter sp. CY312]MCE7043614.1 hypothetical protein [Dyadobacter sp. CY312]